MHKVKQNIETSTETTLQMEHLLICYYLLLSSTSVYISFSWLLGVFSIWGHAQCKLTPRLDAPERKKHFWRIPMIPQKIPVNPLSLVSSWSPAGLRFDEAKPRDWTSDKDVGTPVLHSDLGQFGQWSPMQIGTDRHGSSKMMWWSGWFVMQNVIWVPIKS